MSSWSLSSPRSWTPSGSSCVITPRGDRRLYSSTSDTRALLSRSDENSKPSPRNHQASTAVSSAGTPSDEFHRGSRVSRSGKAALHHKTDSNSATGPSPTTPHKVREHPSQTISQLHGSLVAEAADKPQRPEVIPLWVGLAASAVLLSSSLTVITCSLAAASHLSHHITLHKTRDPLPTQPMRDTQPPPDTAADSDSLPPLPLPVHSTPVSFEGDDRSVQLHLPSPRGPAEVLLGLHRAAGTADAALEAAKAAVRGARHAAELAQAARAQRTPAASPLRARTGGASAASTPRRRPSGFDSSPLASPAPSSVGSPRALPPDRRRSWQPAGPAVDMLLPSPRGPLQVLLERGGHTV
eukprot:jgi/Ulvmu1/10979/UM007_0158.1